MHCNQMLLSSTFLIVLQCPHEEIVNNISTWCVVFKSESDLPPDVQKWSRLKETERHCCDVQKSQQGFGTAAGRVMCSWKRHFLITFHGWTVCMNLLRRLADHRRLSRSSIRQLQSAASERERSRGGRKWLPAGLSVVCVCQSIWSYSTNMLRQERN